MSNDEKTKLKTMLYYWIEHNKEHSQEFREWAEKARSFGEVTAGEEILQAAEDMDKASKFLSQALGRLQEE
ncbi:hypothetical protein ACFLVO_04820 [Chloroflexota bacterium]